ncbi:hypothetical protein LSH36_269g09026 [Paralvinella palmiformis]|uniref:U3 small nucleolar RNA-associated protein 6 N-terminal domain-containing protein n=1 Tax=Paralvinella palmiformis TaxID=53620 RepID=A0AAD9JJV6_9ANNE|nr:hypothetical protein LSH36_269g09026 [Paralvinella palmiformis]
MAEVVQHRIEEMLPELEQMKRIELFTDKETRVILKKRKAYEYKLRRKTKQKEDFLQYIQYEMNVLSLVKRRRQKTGFQFKKVEIDVAIINRIHNLFRKEKGPVGNLYIKMLQIHNRKPELWVLAAKWELEENLSMENARMLLQRGLRYNSKSEHLWQEYFRMELLNADKLRKRRQVLGLAALSKEEADISEEVLNGKVAVVVFIKAVDTLPEKVEFCLSFLPICRLFDFAQVIEEEIFSYLQITYPASELTWEAVALRSLKTPAELSQTISRKEREKLEYENQLEVAGIFQKALQDVNTGR